MGRGTRDAPAVSVSARRLAGVFSTQMRALYQPRHIRNLVALFIRSVAHRHYTQIRLQRRKRIIRNLRLRRRDTRDQRRLTRIRISHQPHIRQQLQLQPVSPFLAQPPRFRFPRSLVNRRGKVLITPAAATTPGNHKTLAGKRKVVHQLARLRVEEARPHRNLQRDRVAVAPGAIRALPMPPTLRLVLRVVPEMDQSIVLLAGLHNHIAATSAIATRRTPAGYKLFAPEGDASVAAITGLHQNLCFINEHKYENPTSYLSSLSKVNL